VRRLVLGHGAGALSTAVVPAGTWQAARAGRAHALVVCTVAPGIEYDDFRLLRDVAGARERIERLAPELAELL
jgi:predicted cupin superfamily sugar epimerase